MKRLFYFVLVLPALQLPAAFHASPTTVSTPGTVAKTTPSGRLSLDLDLGPEMTGTLSRPVLVQRDGPKAEFERARVKALLQVHHTKAWLAEHLMPEVLAQQVADMSYTSWNTRTGSSRQG